MDAGGPAPGDSDGPHIGALCWLIQAVPIQGPLCWPIPMIPTQGRSVGSSTGSPHRGSLLVHPDGPHTEALCWLIHTVPTRASLLALCWLPRASQQRASWDGPPQGRPQRSRTRRRPGPLPTRAWPTPY
eukprot:jgi/Botrbrau1/16295/Bobra.0066s0064.1